MYSDQEVSDYISKHFGYSVNDSPYPGVPHLESIVLEPYKTYDIEGFQVTPVIVEHGRMTHYKIFGYRIGNIAYVTDCSFIPEESFEVLSGVEVMIIGALRKTPHGAHFSFDEAYQAAKRTGAETIYFTHINHNTSYNEINSLYPDAQSAYDTLSFEV